MLSDGKKAPVARDDMACPSFHGSGEVLVVIGVLAEDGRQCVGLGEADVRADAAFAGFDGPELDNIEHAQTVTCARTARQRAEVLRRGYPSQPRSASAR
jgi:hypothetical protein